MNTQKIKDLIMKILEFIAWPISWIAPPHTTSSGKLLDEWAKQSSVSRSYYGNDKNVKPNNYCFWDEYAYIPGWYENDESLRKRIAEHYSKEPK